ncbi:hypothetical protein V8G54_001321 [Vigna mungo]|uniref:PB1-like domain-containing protein n=1 Tax=Vigna mungo TaxID=3915 RepID=A0AAQ3P8Y2_VIGMU
MRGECIGSLREVISREDTDLIRALELCHWSLDVNREVVVRVRQVLRVVRVEVAAKLLSPVGSIEKECAASIMKLGHTGLGLWISNTGTGLMQNTGNLAARLTPISGTTAEKKSKQVEAGAGACLILPIDDQSCVGEDQTDKMCRILLYVMDDIEVVIYHGGKFMNDECLKYEEESDTMFFDPDVWSYFVAVSVVKSLGYDGFKELWFSIGYGPVLDDRLEPLSDDLNGQVHLYVVHTISEAEVIHMIEYNVDEGGDEVAPQVNEGSEGAEVAEGMDDGVRQQLDEGVGAHGQRVEVVVGEAEMREAYENEGERTKAQEVEVDSKRIDVERVDEVQVEEAEVEEADTEEAEVEEAEVEEADVEEADAKEAEVEEADAERTETDEVHEEGEGKRIEVDEVHEADQGSQAQLNCSGQYKDKTNYYNVGGNQTIHDEEMGD